MTKRSKSGFTLVEIAVVIVVIGVLAAVLILVIGGAITKANAKSALQDARNALTGYAEYVIDKGSQNADAIIIAEKKEKLYVFGYIAQTGNLYESEGNFYEYDINSSETLMTELKDKDCIRESADMAGRDVSGEIQNLPRTVRVYEGYRLLDFETEFELGSYEIEIAQGSEAQLTWTVSPDAPVEFTSDDSNIASVDEKGLISGVGIGTAKITARCGNVDVTCTVHVYGFIEFSGDLLQLKQYFENTGTTTTCIRFVKHESYDNNQELLPLKIPAGKNVILDLNGFGQGAMGISYNGPECFIKNEGGNLTVLNSKPESNGVISYQANTDAMAAAVINESGCVKVEGSVAFMINNRCETGDGVDFINKDTAFFTSVKPNPFSFSIYNAKGGHMSLTDCMFGMYEDEGLSEEYWNEYYSIVNDGVIEEITGCAFAVTVKPLVNHGRIIRITDSNFYACGEYITEIENGVETGYFEEATVMMSDGEVGIISNCTFQNHTGTVCEFTSGSVDRIIGCTIMSESGISLATGDDFVLHNLLTDGTYSNKINQKLIAPGYECVEKDGVWIIQESK
ncbi:MAG: Ig-like domain-containing protein [Clostridia bacterium]|nr:Ig-like domain-containing protein [Clostridia bacterium]